MKPPELILLTGILIIFVFAMFPVFSRSTGGSSSGDSNISFLDLNDTPNSYSGQATKLVRVNAGENALEFFTASGIVDTNCDSNPACHLLASTFVWDTNAVLDARYVNVPGDTMTGDLNISTTSIGALQVKRVNNGTLIFNVDTTNDVTSSGLHRGRVDNTYDLGTPSIRWNDGFFGGNLKVDGNISGGDFNFSLSDANGSQSCPAGQALTSVGLVTSCGTAGGGGGSGTTYTSGTPATIQVSNDTNTISLVFDGNFYKLLNPLVPWADVNVTDDLRINTVKDANFGNIRFLGTLSGGDFNYSLGDANGSQSVSTNFALQSVGQTVTSIWVPTENNIDGNALGIVNGLDLNNSLSYSKTDTNCSNNTLCILTGRLNSLFDANVNDFNARDIRARNLNLSNDFNAMDGNIGNDLNVHHNILLDQNLIIDGNIISKDANSWMGTTALPFNINSAEIFCQVPATGGCLWLTSGLNQFAFKIAGLVDTGMAFVGAARATILYSGGNETWRFGLTGASDGLEFQRPRSNNNPVWAGSPATIEGSTYIFDSGNSFDLNQPQMMRNGVWQHLDATMTMGTSKDNTQDANWDFDLNATGYWSLDGNIQNPNMPTSVIGGTAVQAFGANNELRKVVSLQQYKDHIVDINLVYDTSKIYDLRPRAYNEISTGKPYFGFIAEEVVQVLPILGVYDDDGKLESVRYEMLGVMELQEMKKLKAQNQKLQTQVSLLTQIACPPSNQNPLCQQLLATNTTEPGTA